MIGLWNAPATVSAMGFNPAAVAAARTRSHAPFDPLTTICPGALKFAGTRTSPPALSWQSFVTPASSPPMMATMLLGVATAASCMYLPRAATSFSPVSKSNTPARCSAVYSPRLKPAKKISSSFSMTPFDPRGDVTREAGDKNRRLADVGLVKAIIGAVEAERRQIESQNLIRLLEDFAGLFEHIVEILAHSYDLGALSGAEDESLIAHQDRRRIASRLLRSLDSHDRVCPREAAAERYEDDYVVLFDFACAPSFIQCDGN